MTRKASKTAKKTAAKKTPTKKTANKKANKKVAKKKAAKKVARKLPVTQKIHDLTEKHILREAVRPQITDTVYRRQKHPFLAPPATLNPHGRLHQLLQDSMRGSALAALPFYDQKKVIALLDRVPEMDVASQSAFDSVFTGILSACVLQEQFGLDAGAGT